MSNSMNRINISRRIKLDSFIMLNGRRPFSAALIISYFVYTSKLFLHKNEKKCARFHHIPAAGKMMK